MKIKISLWLLLKYVSLTLLYRLKLWQNYPFLHDRDGKDAISNMNI